MTDTKKNIIAWRHALALVQRCSEELRDAFRIEVAEGTSVTRCAVLSLPKLEDAHAHLGHAIRRLKQLKRADRVEDPHELGHELAPVELPPIPARGKEPIP